MPTPRNYECAFKILSLSYVTNFFSSFNNGVKGLFHTFNGEISPRFILRKYYKSKKLAKRTLAFLGRVTDSCATRCARDWAKPSSTANNFLRILYTGMVMTELLWSEQHIKPTPSIIKWKPASVLTCSSYIYWGGPERETGFVDFMYRSIPKPPMPPPGKPPGIWLFWKILVKFPAMLPV